VACRETWASHVAFEDEVLAFGEKPPKRIGKAGSFTGKESTLSGENRMIDSRSEAARSCSPAADGCIFVLNASVAEMRPIPEPRSRTLLRRARQLTSY